MKKNFLVIIMVLSVMSYATTGCGKKTESPEPQKEVASTEATVKETEEIRQPQKCEIHNAEISIPGDYSISSDSTDSNLVYVNADGSKAIGFTYVPNLEVDDTTSIPWDTIVAKMRGNMTIDTYEETAIADLPAIKFFFIRSEGLSGEMAMVVDQNDNSGYTIQMLQSGEFDDESTFNEILSSFHIIQKVVNDAEEGKTETVKEPMTDMEFLTFEDHPKVLDDYEDACLKWNKDKRLSVKEGVWGHWESYGDDPLLYVECRGDSYIEYNKIRLNEINEIEIYFEKCTDDAASLPLEEALPLIKSYIPVEMLKDKCSFDFAVKWTDEDTNERIYEIAYVNENYDTSELVQRDPQKFAVYIITNEDDIVKRAKIGTNAWKSYLGHEYDEWDYDLFEE